eukprot:363869-Chlamydomonas_euryale.AAC.29
MPRAFGTKLPSPAVMRRRRSLELLAGGEAPARRALNLPGRAAARPATLSMALLWTRHRHSTHPEAHPRHGTRRSTLSLECPESRGASGADCSIGSHLGPHALPRRHFTCADVPRGTAISRLHLGAVLCRRRRQHQNHQNREQDSITE